MVLIAPLSTVSSIVCTAIDHVVYRAVPSKTRRHLVEAYSLPNLAGVGLGRDISWKTASLVLPETVYDGQRGSVEKPMPTVGYPVNDY